MIRVIGPRVLIRRIEPPKQKNSLIELVEMAEADPSQFAQVMVIGTQNGEAVTTDFRVGDRVVIKKFSGTPVQVEDESLELVQLDDVLAVIE